MKRLRLNTVLLAGLLTAAGIPHAFAFEADEVAERLKELMLRQQVELDYEAAHLDGDDVTLEGATVTSRAADESFPLGTLTLQDVTEEENGDFRVGTVAIDTFEHEAEDVTVSMVDLTISGLVLPRDAASDPFGGTMRYDRMALARLDVESDEGPIASATDLYADLAVSEEDARMDMNGAMESFSLNLGSVVESGNAARMLEEMDYQEISGSAVMEGSWQASEGRMTLSRYEATVDDAGTLHVMLDFAGYTPEFIRSMEEMTRAMEQDDSGNSMQGMAMLGLMQQLTFHGAAIRFTDDGLTEKTLAHTAREQGGRPADIIAQAKAAIPPQLSPFLGAELAGNIAEAIGTFLENPDNIEISARPESPVPLATLMGAAMGSPEMLVRQIGLRVEANQ